MLRVVFACLFVFFFNYCYCYYYYYYYFERGSPTGFLGYVIYLIWGKDIIRIRDFKATLVRDSGLKDYRGCGMSPKINIEITGLIEGKPSLVRHDGIRTEPYWGPGLSQRSLFLWSSLFVTQGMRFSNAEEARSNRETYQVVWYIGLTRLPTDSCGMIGWMDASYSIRKIFGVVLNGL